MSDTKSIEEKLDEVLAVCAAITAFVCQIPDAKSVEMPKIKGALQANKSLTENQLKLAIDAAREMKHAVQGDGAH